MLCANTNAIFFFFFFLKNRLPPPSPAQEQALAPSHTLQALLSLASLSSRQGSEDMQTGFKPLARGLQRNGRLRELGAGRRGAARRAHAQSDPSCSEPASRLSNAILYEAVEHPGTWYLRGFWNHSPFQFTPQFRSINSSTLSLLHSPTLTSIHDH